VENSSEPQGFDKAAADRLAALDRHFWMRERIRLVERLVARLDCARIRAIELGCGTGDTLHLLEARFSDVIAVDGHEALLEIAEGKSTTATLIQADVSRAPLPDSSADLVVALDVIEHVDPDLLLREARRLAAPNGMLLLAAPAAPALWSEMDLAAGHRCRYTKRQMEAELLRNGWQPAGFTHYQCALFPAVWLSSRLGTRHATGIERNPPAWLDTLFGMINRVETVLSRGKNLPFGSSVLMWARCSEQ